MSANTVLYWKCLHEVFIEQNTESREYSPETLAETQARQVAAPCWGEVGSALGLSYSESLSFWIDEKLVIF